MTGSSNNWSAYDKYRVTYISNYYLSKLHPSLPSVTVQVVKTYPKPESVVMQRDFYGLEGDKITHTAAVIYFNVIRGEFELK